MKLSGILLCVSVAAATVLRRQGNSNNNGTIENPFAGLPNLSNLGICTTECQTVFQTQGNPPSDWSTTCTATFASAVQMCLNCLSTNIPSLLLSDEVKAGVTNTLEIYQKNCLTLVSTTEAVTLPTALSATGTQFGGTSPHSSLPTGSGTASSALASTNPSAAANLKIQTPRVALAAAFVVALAAF